MMIKQQIDASANVSVLSGGTEAARAGTATAVHVIDSSRIKIKASANNIQQPLNKNLKISPYQIAWSSNQTVQGKQSAVVP